MTDIREDDLRFEIDRAEYYHTLRNLNVLGISPEYPLMRKLAERYLAIEGFPEKIRHEVRTSAGIMETDYSVGFNAATDACKLAHLKEMEKKEIQHAIERKHFAEKEKERLLEQHREEIFEKCGKAKKSGYEDGVKLERSKMLERLSVDNIADVVEENSAYQCKCEPDITCFRCLECKSIAHAIHELIKGEGK